MIQTIALIILGVILTFTGLVFINAGCSSYSVYTENDEREVVGNDYVVVIGGYISLFIGNALIITQVPNIIA